MQSKIKKNVPALLKWILWVLLVQFVLFNISASLYAYRLTHFYIDSSLAGKKSSNILARTWRLFTGPRFIKIPPGREPSFVFENLSFITSGGTIIHGWFARTDSAARGTVLMFHGVTAQKSQMLDEAEVFRQLGLNVLMIDFRGHGRSEGRMTTLGFDEIEEVKIAWDHMTKLGEKKIFLYGVSMGAVTVSRAINELGLTPEAVIIEMPFESLRTHLRARARTLGFPGFPEKPFSFLVGTWIGWERGFNAASHNTTRYAKKMRCPVLLQWGDRDEYVQSSEIQSIFQSIASGNKKLVVYTGAGHQSLLQFDPAKWKSAVNSFISGSLQGYPAE